MTVMVALLRGVNVGGQGKLPMADLRTILADCGYDDIQTYIQSGNAVFSTSTRSAAAVERDLAAAIAAATDVAPAVMVRTRAQLDTAIADNPFRLRGEDADHLHVTFSASTDQAVVTLKDLAKYAPEEAIAVGSQVYFFLPNGLGRSKLAAAFARQKSPPGTTRNWRTVTKLQSMAATIA